MYKWKAVACRFADNTTARHTPRPWSESAQADGDCVSEDRDEEGLNLFLVDMRTSHTTVHHGWLDRLSCGNYTRPEVSDHSVGKTSNSNSSLQLRNSDNRDNETFLRATLSSVTNTRGQFRRALRETSKHLSQSQICAVLAFVFTATTISIHPHAKQKYCRDFREPCWFATQTQALKGSPCFPTTSTISS